MDPFYLQSDPIPGPLPLGVAVIDSSVRLYGVIFPHVAHKHRYQMLQHFIECIRQAKSSRQQAVQMNIFTAVLCALKVGKKLRRIFCQVFFSNLFFNNPFQSTFVGVFFLLCVFGFVALYFFCFGGLFLGFALMKVAEYSPVVESYNSSNHFFFWGSWWCSG